MNQQISYSVFFDLAVAHGEAILVGDHKTANKLYKRLMKIYNHAKSADNLQVFYSFLDNENESVGLWAATFTLAYDSEKAINTLKRISKSKFIFGLSAETTLDCWSKGLLNLL